MNIDCSTIQEMLSAYIDGELSAEKRGVVDAHLAACSACREELSSLRQMNSLLLNISAPAPSSRVDELFAAKLSAHQARRLRWALPVYGRLAWAAGLAAMLLLAFIFYGRSRPPVIPTTVHTAAVLPVIPDPPPAVRPAARGDNRTTNPVIKDSKASTRSPRRRPLNIRNTVIARVEREHTVRRAVVIPVTVEPDPTYAAITETVEPAPDVSPTSYDEATLAAATNPPPEIAVMAMLTETTDF